MFEQAREIFTLTEDQVADRFHLKNNISVTMHMLQDSSEWFQCLRYIKMCFGLCLWNTMPPTKYKEGGVSECMKFQHPSLGKECMFHNFITLKPAILYAMQVNSLVNGTINFLKCLNLMRGNTLLTSIISDNIRHITTGHTVWQLIN